MLLPLLHTYPILPYLLLCLKNRHINYFTKVLLIMVFLKILVAFVIPFFDPTIIIKLIFDLFLVSLSGIVLITKVTSVIMLLPLESILLATLYLMKILSLIPPCCRSQNPFVPRPILATHLSLYSIKLLNKCVHILLHTLSLQGHYQIFQLHHLSLHLSNLIIQMCPLLYPLRLFHK